MGRVWAQLPVGQWRSHHVYDQSLGLAWYEGKLYSALPYAILVYDPETGLLDKITSVQGLAQGRVTALCVAGSHLVIGFANGAINVLQGGGLLLLDDVLDSSARFRQGDSHGI